MEPFVFDVHDLAPSFALELYDGSDGHVAFALIKKKKQNGRQGESLLRCPLRGSIDPSRIKRFPKGNCH